MGLLKERVAIRRILESGNIHFVRDFEPGHYYSPLPDAHRLKARAGAVFDQSLKDIPGVNLNEHEQISLVDAFSALYPEMPFHEAAAGAKRYFLDNPFFSYGDGIVLYGFLRHLKPKRFVEIGSGYSSAEVLDVNELFFGNQINLTFVEPYPDRLFGLLSEGDKQRARIEIKPVQEVDLDVFHTLGADDILFVDSSHIAKVDSDVLYLLFDVLPRLNRGVIIHFHDILWPFEYPEEWFNEGRAWNEAYFLRAFLQYNSMFEVVYFNSYMALHHREKVKRMPLALKQPSTPETFGNSSLWLRKVA